MKKISLLVISVIVFLTGCGVEVNDKTVFSTHRAEEEICDLEFEFKREGDYWVSVSILNPFAHSVKVELRKADGSTHGLLYLDKTLQQTSYKTYQIAIERGTDIKVYIWFKENWDLFPCDENGTILEM